jgi:hypothetical protein
VPVQALGTMLAIAGYFLGHKHKGRQFAPNIHATFATSLTWMLVSQVIIGIYLKLHLEKGLHARIRRYIVTIHGIIGKLMPVVSWVQMLFGGITALGFCRADHTGQCLAHFIMGSAFIGYGITLIIILLAGQPWLRRTGRSQEFFDSTLIAAWGCVNTFTEHRWGQPWGGNDLQHTSMGIVWWCAGILGMWLSRSRDGLPKRNVIPAIVIIITGWAMSAHEQHLMLSTMMHTVFGYTLMAAGAARIIEISFVLRDRSSLSHSDVEYNSSFQFLTPFVSIPRRSLDAVEAGCLLSISSFAPRDFYLWVPQRSKWRFSLDCMSPMFRIFLFFTASPSCSCSSSSFCYISMPAMLGRWGKPLLFQSPRPFPIHRTAVWLVWTRGEKMQRCLSYKV